MNRTFMNLLIDLSAAFLFLGMMATGYILHFPLPPGTNKIFMLWGLTRHQWGGIHFSISLGFLAILFVHIVLHWQWLVTVIARRFHLRAISRSSMIRSGFVILVVFISAFSLFAWATHNSIQKITEPIVGLCPPDEPSETSPLFKSNQDSARIEFWTNVYPILENKCISCHGPRKQLANFRVDQPEEFFGKNNKDALIIQGNSSQSPLIEVVSGARKNMPMADIHKLPEEELSLLKSWIDQGAKCSKNTNS